MTYEQFKDRLTAKADEAGISKRTFKDKGDSYVAYIDGCKFVGNGTSDSITVYFGARGGVAANDRGRRRAIF